MGGGGGGGEGAIISVIRLSGSESEDNQKLSYQIKMWRLWHFTFHAFPCDVLPNDLIRMLYIVEDMSWQSIRYQILQVSQQVPQSSYPTSASHTPHGKVTFQTDKNQNSFIFLKITMISLTTSTASIQAIYLAFNIACWNIYANHNKSRLLYSSAEMFKKPLWQTVLTQIRLLLVVHIACSCPYVGWMDTLAHL